MYCKVYLYQYIEFNGAQSDSFLKTFNKVNIYLNTIACKFIDSTDPCTTLVLVFCSSIGTIKQWELTIIRGKNTVLPDLGLIYRFGYSLSPDLQGVYSLQKTNLELRSLSHVYVCVFSEVHCQFKVVILNSRINIISSRTAENACLK
jgi:hypothetical protein